MVGPPRRALDWTTAWEALVPVYGVAVISHAIHPLFSAPLWPIFGYYAYRVLDAARAAVDPWRGRGSPRPYMLTCFATVLVHLVTFATSVASVTSAVSGAVGLSTAAIFVRGSGPRQVREGRAIVLLGVVAMIVSSLVAPAYAFGAAPVEGTGTLLAVVGQLGLAAVSVAAFLLAGRAARRRAPVVARKVARP
ncbi:MAG: hypothetical protein ACT4OI_11405 [Methanobacteriota archaeon]